MIRFLDITFSLIGLIILSPLLIVVSLIVSLSGPGGVIYKQQRIGRFGTPFWIYKFRTMKSGSDKKGLLSVGNRDSRITPVGYYLRKFKLDELPQLWNVLIGDMSLVGPRPEVEKYTRLYSDNQRNVLNVRPGITDPASIFYRNENELLAKSSDPENTYISEILPHKIELSKKYASNPKLPAYFKYLLLTIIFLFKK
jgi:lipopolysaccharide/colanic/teichoic acid biosynthesis glycosyltransferase